MIGPSAGIVKICGLRDVVSAGIAAGAGADMLGFVLAPSRRQVPPELLVAFREGQESRPGPRPTLVGVTVNLKAREIADLVARSGMDIVQLSGDESLELLDAIDVPVIRALHVNVGIGFEEAARRADLWMDHPRAPMALLVDSSAKGQYGGTGLRADWTVAAALAERFPVMLAGGLDPENVAEAVASVRPLGVDVASGVEVDGVKDPVRIRAFVAAARGALETRAGEMKQADSQAPST